MDPKTVLAGQQSPATAANDVNNVNDANNANSVDFRGRRLRLLAILAGALLLYLAGAYSGWLSGTGLAWWNDFFWTAAALLAGWRCVRTARSRVIAHKRVAWYLFGLAALSWFVGMLIWDYAELVAGTLLPFPGISDYFFAAFGVLATLGCFYYRMHSPVRTHNSIQIANLGIIISAIMVLSYIILAPLLQQQELGLGYRAMAFLLSITAIIGFVFSVYCYWFYIWTQSRRSFSLMVLALGIHAVTNTLYAYQLLGHTFDLSSYLNVYWLVAFAIQYWAAFEQEVSSGVPAAPADGQDKTVEEKYEAVMPSLCILVVILAAVIHRGQLDADSYFVLVIGAVVFTVFLAVREWQTNSLEITLRNAINAARQDLEQRVTARTTELAKAMQEMESFNYSVSHDLRAPLRVINGFSQVLLDDYAGKIDVEGRRYLQKISNNATRMSDLIDAMLKLSMLNRQDLKKDWINLSAVAADITRRLRDEEPLRDVKVTIDEGLRLHGDVNLVRVIIENLLSNAWKYTRKVEHAAIHFGKQSTATGEVFFVRDNGIGFDMAYVDKIFLPFRRLHTNEYEGIGVGLATVSRCIERHGGRIWAQAAVNQGATFYFNLSEA